MLASTVGSDRDAEGHVAVNWGLNGIMSSDCPIRKRQSLQTDQSRGATCRSLPWTTHGPLSSRERERKIFKTFKIKMIQSKFQSGFWGVGSSEVLYKYISVPKSCIKFCWTHSVTLTCWQCWLSEKTLIKLETAVASLLQHSSTNPSFNVIK